MEVVITKLIVLELILYVNSFKFSILKLMIYWFKKSVIGLFLLVTDKVIVIGDNREKVVLGFNFLYDRVLQ